jgi:hypothetical protein
VEVDPETWTVTPRDVFVVHDCGTPIHPRLMDFLRENNLDKPVVEIFNTNAGRKKLKDLGFGDFTLSSEQAIVIFHLPKPLDFFWWKGAPEFIGGLPVHGTAIEWGKIYDELLHTIWEEVGREECEGELDFARVNDKGHHEKGIFYYIWSVSRHSPDRSKEW